MPDYSRTGLPSNYTIERRTLSTGVVVPELVPTPEQPIAEDIVRGWWRASDEAGSPNHRRRSNMTRDRLSHRISRSSK